MRDTSRLLLVARSLVQKSALGGYLMVRPGSGGRKVRIGRKFQPTSVMPPAGGNGRKAQATLLGAGPVVPRISSSTRSSSCLCLAPFPSSPLCPSGAHALIIACAARTP
jgi:hypothetical protein